MQNPLAVIDVGTNSVLYLVAEVKQNANLKIIEEGVNITRLGRGTHESKKLDSRAMHTTVQAIKSFYQRAQCLGVQQTFIIATSAVRDAENRRGPGVRLPVRGRRTVHGGTY